MLIDLALLGLSCAMQDLWLPYAGQLWRLSSEVGVHGLSFSMAYGILVLPPGIEPTSPALQGKFLTSGLPGKSLESSQQFLKVMCSTVIVKTMTKRCWRKQQGNQSLVEFAIVVLSSGLTPSLISSVGTPYRGPVSHLQTKLRAFLVAQMVKNMPAMRETWIHSLSLEDPLEEGMANPLQHSCLESLFGQGSLVGSSPWVCKELDMTG